MYGVVLHAHPVRGESHNQRNTTGEVATVTTTRRVSDLLFEASAYNHTTVAHGHFLNQVKSFSGDRYLPQMKGVQCDLLSYI